MAQERIERITSTHLWIVCNSLYTMPDVTSHVNVGRQLKPIDGKLPLFFNPKHDNMLYWGLFSVKLFVNTPIFKQSYRYMFTVKSVTT